MCNGQRERESEVSKSKHYPVQMRFIRSCNRLMSDDRQIGPHQQPVPDSIPQPSSNSARRPFHWLFFPLSLSERLWERCTGQVHGDCPKGTSASIRVARARFLRPASSMLNSRTQRERERLWLLCARRWRLSRVPAFGPSTATDRAACRRLAPRVHLVRG